MQNRSVVSLMRQLPLLYRCTALPLLSGPTSCDRCSSLPTLRICPTAPPRRASCLAPAALLIPCRAPRHLRSEPPTTATPSTNRRTQPFCLHSLLSLSLSLVPFQPAILPPAHSLSLCSSPRSLTRPPLAESNHPFRSGLVQSATRSLHAIDHHNPPRCREASPNTSFSPCFLAGRPQSTGSRTRPPCGPCGFSYPPSPASSPSRFSSISAFRPPTPPRPRSHTPQQLL